MPDSTTPALTYALRVKNLKHCCFHSIHRMMVNRMVAGTDPPQDGDTFTTTCCDTPLIHRDGAWEWDVTREPV